MHTTLESVAHSPQLRAALAAIEAQDDETLADMRAVTEIPAPYRGESARASWIAGRFAEIGLAGIRADAEGNVLAGASGDDVASAIMLAAHLDTVFPPETDVRVREADPRLCAPGISDNGRGVAALLRLATVLQQHPLLDRPVLFAATVGEEGAGDLRGVKHFFGQGARPAAFIAVDGAGMQRVVHRAVGSRRYRATFTGPGGHSWSDRGTANPAHALGEAIASLESLRRTAGERAAVSVGRLAGGTSVNAIPQSAWLELDLRAESATTLARLDREACAALARAASPPIELHLELMGDRPGGETPREHPLVQAAVAATVHFGVVPELAESSTDANVPMSLGIPSIALGAGGEAAGMHTLNEWYSNEGGACGIQRLLLTVVQFGR